MAELVLDVLDSPFGTWRASVTGPQGSHVTGLAVRYENPVGGGTNDDTALNGLRMEVSSFPPPPGPGQSPSQSPPQAILVNEGYWGTWRNMVRVPNGYYIVGISVRNEAGQGPGVSGGHDDTGLNGIRLKLRQCHGTGLQSLTIWEGDWGDWTPDTLVPEGYCIVGFQPKIEAPQGGGNNDDMAMTGLRILLRPKPF